MSLPGLLYEYRIARYSENYNKATSLAHQIRGLIEAKGYIPEGLTLVNRTACVHALAVSEGGKVLAGETIRRTDSKTGNGRAGDVLSLPFRLHAGKAQVKGVIPPHMRIADDERNGVLTVFAMRGKERSGYRRLNVADLRALTVARRKFKVGGRGIDG